MLVNLLREIQGIKIVGKNGKELFVSRDKMSQYMVDKILELVGGAVECKPIMLIESPTGHFAIGNLEETFPAMPEGYRLTYVEKLAEAYSFSPEGGTEIGMDLMLARLGESQKVCKISRLVTDQSGVSRSYLIADNINLGWLNSIRKILTTAGISYTVQDIHAKAEVAKNTQKLVATENYWRDSESEHLIADHVDKIYAKLLIDGLKELTQEGAAFYPVLKEDDYKLYTFEV